MPGDIVFSVGALLMAWDFIVKLRRPRWHELESRRRTAAVPAE